jgi:hypothetical protein
LHFEPTPTADATHRRGRDHKDKGVAYAAELLAQFGKDGIRVATGFVTIFELFKGSEDRG